MEDLLQNDASFEVYANSEGAELLNRTLLSYPSEKSSFQVFLGFEGEEADTQVEKASVNPEKISQAISDTAGAISSVGSTIQAFKGDSTKPKSRRKELKEVCGRKPVLKKNRAEYDKCVADYNAGKIGNVTPTTRSSSVETTPPPPPPPTTNNTKKIIIGLVVVGVVVTAFYGYKKGWFSKKG